MALPVSVADINAFTNRWIVPRTTDVIYKDSPLFSRLISKNRVGFDGGTSITVPLIYAKLNGGFFSKGDSFNTAYVVTDTAFSINMKYAHVNMTLYGTDDVLNRGRNAAFSTVETKMANASMRMAEIIATSFYGDGTSSQADVTTSSNVLSTTQAFDGLLQWIDDGNSSGSYSTATDVTRSFLSVGGITRNDLFVTSPSFSGSTTPTSAIAGANAYTERAFTNFSLNAVNTAYGNAWFGNKYVDLMLLQQAGWNRFWNAIQPNQRFLEESSDLAKIGFPVLKFNAASLVVDKYMPDQLLLGLNTNYIKLYISDNKRWQFGFTGFKEAQNTVDLAGQYLFSGNLAVENARTCFKMTGSGLA